MSVPTKEWIALEITIPYELEDAAGNFCHECGCSGVHIEEVGNELIRLSAYFPSTEATESAARLKEYLKNLSEAFPDLPQPSVVCRPVKSENWAVMWKENFKSLPIGKSLLVTPPWIEPVSSERRVIVIEPAEAFGTGTHETTQGCLILLERAVDSFPENAPAPSLLDVGCGSGILAIAGKKLGAGKVLGLDNDPIAVESALKNARLNHVETGLELKCTTPDELHGQWDILTANLDPLTLRQHADSLMRLCGKLLIISGVPLDQWSSVKTVFTARGATLVDEITRSEWGSGLFETATRY